MNWLILLKYALQFAAYFARRAERREVEKSILNEIENLHDQRLDRARSARDDVMSGRVPDDDNDPNLRG